MKETKKMGRPEVPAYRKKLMRYSRVEDSLKAFLNDFESEKDREMMLTFLKQLRA